MTIIDATTTHSTAESASPPTGSSRRSGPSACAGPSTDTGRFGRFGEQCAADWYCQNGYEVLSRNWRCSRGELDLIVARGPLVAFVEVKARSSRRFGSGAEAVDWRKQSRIRSLASHWLDQHQGWYTDLRFDVVDVDRRGHLDVFQDCF
ncbi:MAG: YraN family protein [Acidimicrobiales bacterium]